jgi:hypothetical protein
MSSSNQGPGLGDSKDQNVYENTLPSTFGQTTPAPTAPIYSTPTSTMAQQTPAGQPAPPSYTPQQTYPPAYGQVNNGFNGPQLYYPPPPFCPNQYPQPPLIGAPPQYPGAYYYPQQQQSSVVLFGAPPPQGTFTVQETPRYQSFVGAVVLSCFTFWFCGVIFGAIAFILAISAHSSASSGDQSTARRLSRASFAVSITGIVIGMGAIIVIASLLGSLYSRTYTTNCYYSHTYNCPY